MKRTVTLTVELTSAQARAMLNMGISALLCPDSYTPQGLRAMGRIYDALKLAGVTSNGEGSAKAEAQIADIRRESKR